MGYAHALEMDAVNDQSYGFHFISPIVLDAIICPCYYVDILKTRTSSNVTITSVMAEIKPKTKLSGLYPLVQHNLEIPYARVNALAIYISSHLKRRTTENAPVMRYANKNPTPK